MNTTTLDTLQFGDRFLCVEPETRKTLRAKKEEDTVFVFAPSCTKSGWRHSDEYFSRNYIILPQQTKTQQWHSRIWRAMKAMDESGLWTEYRQLLENCLTMTWEDRQEMLFLRLRHRVGARYVKEEWQEWIDKYPFIESSDAKGNFIPNEDYICRAISRVELKSMYFGEENRKYKGKIRGHLEAKTDNYSIRMYAGYDVSFQYFPEKAKAYYSEECRKEEKAYHYMALNEHVAWLYDTEY